MADENTTFRKHREPVTLADVQVGDMVRVEGAVKDGIFVAASVSVMGMRPGRNADGAARSRAHARAADQIALQAAESTAASAHKRA